MPLTLHFNYRLFPGQENTIQSLSTTRYARVTLMTQSLMAGNYKKAVGPDAVIDTECNRDVQRNQGAGTRTGAERKMANRARTQVISEAMGADDYSLLPQLVEDFMKYNEGA